MPQLLTFFCFFLEYFDVANNSPGLSRTAPSEKLITIVNDFILTFEETFATKLPNPDEDFFKLITMVRIIEYMFTWMYKMRYSKSWVKIN